MSTPFVDQEFTFTQPDGSTITLIGTGNQNLAAFRTPDGVPMVRDPATGGFVPAGGLESVGGEPPVSASGLEEAPMRWEQRRDERLEGLESITEAPPPRQTVGTFVGLCLLIDFSDAPSTITQAQVAEFCNTPGYRGFGNNGSVRDYFFDNSDGKLTYTNIVAPYYRAKHPKTYYTDPTVQPFGTRPRELILEALDHHLANGFDFRPLSSDNQNFVYAINVFYAGANDNAWSEGLWPHASVIPTRVLAPGKIAHDYQITNMGPELTLGIFCHENGHLICDFPDLYEYGPQTKGVGAYCLMCLGGNVDPRNPHQVGAYLKMGAGWASKVVTIAPNKSVTLTAGRNEFAVHRRNTAEYYLLENRARAGRDATLPDAGLAIWRVFERGSNTHPAGTFYECALVQADNKLNLENANNFGDSGDFYDNIPANAFTDTSKPNSKWRDGAKSNLKINKVGPAGPTITFTT